MLAEATLSRPYARAAFQAAKAAGTLDEWSQALALAAAMVVDERVRELIGSPRLEPHQLAEWLVGPDHEDPRFENFLKILSSYRRLPLLPEIAAQFEQLRREHTRRIKVTVTSAIDLNPQQQQVLSERLQARFEREVELETEVDPSLLGGFIARAGDQVIDASLRGRLEQLGRELTR